ncbi:isoprenoid synthase domain-containing protein [Podospora didyma]|uniref:Isoprenoid synthase domain-containing protein n=1 Tax=Podospora didyma TaxID=330526 RepID=A0AAE0KJH2_9PEZI|nr:isoprenoid synthase domain-containing protein [Podospora didyma]
MNHQFSHLLDASAYDTDGLCGGLLIRVHKHAELATAGALRAQRDWKELIGPLTSNFCGSLAPISLTAVAAPGCRPERLEIVSYVIELGFLCDDLMDNAQDTASRLAMHVTTLMDEMKNGVESGLAILDGPAAAAAGSFSSSTISPEQRRLAINFVQGLMAVDVPASMALFGRMMRHIPDITNNHTRTEFGDLDEYLEFRVINFATRLIIAALIFGMGLTISAEEEEICLELSRPAWQAAILVNDIQSWEVEYSVALEQKVPLTNAIWVLMKQHSLSLDEAKELCREKSKTLVAEYMSILGVASGRDDLSKDARALLESLQYMITGNVVWGFQSPRYDPRVERALPNEFAPQKVTNGEENDVNGVNDHHKDVETLPADCGTDTVEVGNGIISLDVPQLDTQVVDAPCQYLDSLPSKGVRDRAVDALNVWFDVSPEDIVVIKRVISLVHGGSLMLDDIQDGSKLRRGKPSTHEVFGEAQTFNSAGHRLVQAFYEIRQLGKEMQHLVVGQSYDLSWTCNMECPTEEEYLSMVDGKTASLFRMLARLMDAKSHAPSKPDLTSLTQLMTLLGRYFQIRDDYMNLTSADKGFCEDLDEGKYSLPLIHALNQKTKDITYKEHTTNGKATNRNSGTAAAGCKEGTEKRKALLILRNILTRRRLDGKMSLEQKHLVLEQLRESGSMEYTLAALRKLFGEIQERARQLGTRRNEPLEALMSLLKVSSVV